MKTNLSFFIFIFIYSFTHSQSVEWVTEIKNFNGIEFAGPYVTAKGDNFLTGSLYFSSPSFGNIDVPLNDKVTYNYFLAKCTPSGNFEWVKTGGGWSYNKGNAVVEDYYGNIYSTGKCDGNVQFDNIYLPYKQSPGEAFLLKYDKNGNTKWLKRFEGYPGLSANGQGGTCVKYLNGYIYAFGTVGGLDETQIYNYTFTYENEDMNGMIYWTKFDTIGNFIWAKKIAEGFESDITIRDAIAIGNDIVITGYFSTSIAQDTIKKSMFCCDTYQSFIARYNSNGKNIWFKIISSTNFTNFVLDIDTDEKGNILATGVYNDTLTIDSVSLIKHSDSTFNSFVCKFNSKGQLKWIKDISGLGDINSIGLCHNSNYLYISGYYYGNLRIDNFLMSSPYNYSIFILELDTLGNFIHGEKYAGEPYIQTNGMGIDHQGNIYISGLYCNSATIGQYQLYGDTASNNNCYHPRGYLFKYKPLTMIVPENSNITNYSTIFPNPNNGNFSIKINDFKSYQNYKIEILNIIGYKIKEFKINKQISVINCPELPSGIYFIKIITNDNLFLKKFIVEKD